MTESLFRVSALIRYNALLRLRDPAQLVSYLVTPMILMVLFRPLYARAVGAGQVQAVTGQLVMFSIFAMAIVGNSIFLEREWRTWDRLRVSRSARAELLAGKAIPVFLVLLFQQFVLIIYGILVIGLPVPRLPGLLLLATSIWGFTLLAMGSMMATLMRSWSDLIVASDLGAITISAIGGTLLPVSLMPGWARAIAPFSPGYWGLRIIRAAVQGDPAGVLRAAPVCLAIGIVTGTIATYRLARGWGRSHLL
jgi:ABC-2 type transport system permease protein